MYFTLCLSHNFLLLLVALATVDGCLASVKLVFSALVLCSEWFVCVCVPFIDFMMEEIKFKKNMVKWSMMKQCEA